MQVKTLLAIPFLSGLVAAMPAAESAKAAKTHKPFEVLALRSASDIHFASVSAAKGSLFLKLPKQGASCHRKSDGYATFRLTKDGELYLYSTDNPPQQVYADRSGMGQGKVGYVTGAQPPPKNGELKGWEIDKTGNLSLDGASLLACPNSIHDAWSIWVSSGVANPGGNKNCLGFSARTTKVKKPNSCLYTE
ncbi:cell wall [Fusarium albosuccineum]|uniref:Cell wall n=1 Tax=Fusarium albosuccineum TaxID=1237068 RepID=A0A8H4L4Z5_9HYPO|nr:cell wall [Fusarium albosuccineum]